MDDKVTGRLKLALKGVVSVGFLWWAFTKAPIHQIIGQFSRLQPGWLACGIAISAFIVWSQAMRWKELVSIGRTDAPASGEFLRLTLVGYFFNVFLPSSVGGDAVKSIVLGKQIGNMFSAVASSILIRVMGVGALTVFFWLGLAFSGQTIPVQLVWAMAGITAAFLVALGVFLAPLESLQLPGRLKEWPRSLGEFKKSPKTMFRCLLQTVVMQLAVILAQVAFFRTVNAELGFWQSALFTPLVNVVTMIPVSINGIGIREMAVLSTFGSVPALSGQVCLAATGVAYLMVIIQAVIGGILFWIGKR